MRIIQYSVTSNNSELVLLAIQISIELSVALCCSKCGKIGS